MMIHNLSKAWRERLQRRYTSWLPEELIESTIKNLIDTHEKFTASGCADKDFTKHLLSSDINQSTQRLGEMLLYERLTHTGYDIIKATSAGGPDFRVNSDGQRICLELITPTTGNDRKITALFSSHDPLSPCPIDARELQKRTLLRVTSAVSEKLKKYEKYINRGIVSREDKLIIVINDALLCPDKPFFGVYHGANSGVGGYSLSEHAVLGLGYSVWKQTETKGNYKAEQTIRDVVENNAAPSKSEDARAPIPVNLFGKPVEVHSANTANRAKILSGVMQVTLREDYGFLMFMREKAENEDLIFATNLYGGVVTINPNSANQIKPKDRFLLSRIINKCYSEAELLDAQKRHLQMMMGVRGHD